MKPYKIVIIIGGGLLLLAVATIGLIAATVDANMLKHELSRIVMEKKQRNLRIDGEAALSFFPSMGVKLGRVSLSEHGSDAGFAAFDSARVSIQVIPLLSKRFVVDRIELDGVKATLIRRKDGSLNIADLMSKEKDDSAMVKFDIAGVRIANAQLDWRDEKAGQHLTLSDLALTTDHLSNAASGSMTLSTRMLSEKPKINASLQLATQYDYDLDAKRYGLAKLDATLKGRQGADDFNIHLEAPKLALGSGKAGGERISLSTSLVGSGRNVAAKLTLSGFEGSTQLIKADKLALELDARAGDTSVKGALETPLSANLQTQVIALPKITGSVDVASPAMPMKQLKLPIAGRLTANLLKQDASGEITTQFDESHLRASIKVSKFSPLGLGFDLDIDRLNVDKYRPPADKSAATGKTSAAAPTNDRIDLSALKALNLNGSVHIGSLQVNNIKATNVRFNLKAAAGKLDVAPHTASLYDGTVSGSLSVNADGNRIVLKENLSDVRINPLMKDAVGKDLIEGQGNITLDLNTHGETVAAMKKALSGSARLLLKDGAIKGIDLAKTLRDLKAKISAKQDAVQQANTVDKTDFSELSASFAIANGVAHNDDLTAKSPFLRLSGNGDIDVGNGQMNYLAKATVVSAATGQGGKELESLKGLTVPVRVTGPFTSLSYHLEFGGLLQDAAKAKVEEKKQEIQQKLQDGLNDKLKGLFGK